MVRSFVVNLNCLMLLLYEFVIIFFFGRNPSTVESTWLNIFKKIVKDLNFISFTMTVIVINSI